MNLRAYATAMATYNAWMNGKIYDAAATLPDEARKRDVGAFFGSLHATLDHLVVTDEAWMQRLHGETVTMTSPREQRHAEFAAMRATREALDRRISAWADTLPEGFAAGEYRFFSVTYQRELVLPGWAVVIQVFNHQTHHRGQASTLLMQLGVDPGVTDFPWMPMFTGAA